MPDGALINLIGPGPSGRSIYDDDFILFEPLPPDDGAMRIDHVAYALQQGYLDSFALFYRAIFGMQPQPLHELPNPHGLIRSRAMVSGDGTVRLALNVSESHKTTTGRFVRTYEGAGVHHIAFATGDIVSTLSKLAELGARTLPIPANYYDDLAARYGLHDTYLSELAALNLLYDREDGGEFLHAYMDAFNGRFFFEIVQRGGYHGFGAQNAAVRMAAQAAASEAGLSSRVAVL